VAFSPDVKPLLDDDFSDPKKGFEGGTVKQELGEVGYEDGHYVMRTKLAGEAGHLFWSCPGIIPASRTRSSAGPSARMVRTPGARTCCVPTAAPGSG
jgi:hypothetical protein